MYCGALRSVSMTVFLLQEILEEDLVGLREQRLVIKAEK